MTKIDAMLKTLEALAQASRGGYRCNTEIEALYDAILKEIAKLDDNDVESIEGVAHLLANKWLPITESEASALLKGVIAGDPQLRQVYERYGSTSADWSCFEPLAQDKAPADVYTRPRDGGEVRVATRYADPDIAHTLRFFYGLSPSEVSQMSPQDIAEYLRHAVNLSQESVISSGTPDAIDVEQQMYRAEMKARESE